jgi:hypothetical protein
MIDDARNHEREDFNKCIFILIYIQQDATLHSLFYLETALNVSGGTTTNHQERKQLYLQNLVFFRPLLLRYFLGVKAAGA